MTRVTSGMIALFLLVTGLAGCGESEPAAPPGASAAAASAERAEWHATVDGVQSGPFTETELRARIVDERVAPSDLVWREGMDEWAPVDAVLRSALGVEAIDAAGAAFLGLCIRAAAVPRADMATLETYAVPDAQPRPPTGAVRATLGRHAKLVADARDGLRAIGTVRPRYAAGNAMLLPHLSPARQLAKLLRADALREVENGNIDAAIADAAAIGRLARQVAQDEALLSSKVSVAMALLFGDLCSRLDLDVDGHAGLAQIAVWLRGDDPFGIDAAAAITREFGFPDPVEEQRTRDAARRAMERLEPVLD